MIGVRIINRSPPDPACPWKADYPLVPKPVGSSMIYGHMTPTTPIHPLRNKEENREENREKRKTIHP